MINKKILILSALSIFLINIQYNYAQQTIQLKDGITPPKANITDVAWIAGHWQGEAFGGTIEESWTPPLGNSMMGIFKLVNDGKTNFYEIIIISEEDETLVMKLKHFHSDLRGWEEKDEYIEAKLVKLETNKAYFEGFTYEKVDDMHLNIYVLMEEDGKHSEMKFTFEQVATNNLTKN